MKPVHSLFDSLLEPCFVLNKDLKVVYCNETAAAVCGLTVRKVQRSTFAELFTFSEPLEWMGAIEAVTDPSPYKEVHFKTSEGGEGKVQITCQELPAAEGAERTWIVFVRDVTLEERLQLKYRGELEQKENYARNLEKMVEERTAEIRQLNVLMAALLDSLGQGFFAFDKDGLCHDFSSKACETVLEGRPNKRPVWEVLKLPEARVDGFKKWLTTLFADMLPFEDLAPLGPPVYPHSAGQHIKLEYFPLKNENGIDGVVVVASDITTLVEAQREAETERENARLILNLLNKRQQISRFARETQLMVAELERIMKTEHAGWDAEEIFRALHTIKGGCASFNVARTAHEAHEAENRLTAFKENPSPETAGALREQSAKTAAEFRAFISETEKILGPAAFSGERHVDVPVRTIRTVCERMAAVPLLNDVAAALKKTYLLEPAGPFFEPYDDVMQKVAAAEGKNVLPLKISGGDLAVSPEVYSSLFATFVHAFRNAVDHGIERPDARLEQGKPDAGRIEVSLERRHDRLVVTVTDDGAGIDAAKIRAKLAGKGVDAAKESDDQVIQHVFDSSFSTRDAVSETSGRGVGMDAIKSAAEALHGTCRVSSHPGRGTVLTVDVPWTEDAVKAPAAKAA